MGVDGGESSGEKPGWKSGDGGGEVVEKPGKSGEAEGEQGLGYTRLIQQRVG